jgi:phosphoribosylformylglycinamidine cyclo-ligase
VPRTLPDGLGVEIETGAWPVPRIFTLIQGSGDIADEEMARTFNLGIGMTAVVPASLADAALDAVPDACRIGCVVEAAGDGPRVRFA